MLLRSGSSPLVHHHRQSSSSSSLQHLSQSPPRGTILSNVREARVSLESTDASIPDDESPSCRPANPASGWDLQEIWQWYNDLPWLAGMNYLPRTAVNFIEMWDEHSFDPAIIEQELQWAADKLGYNTLRTNLPMVLYEADARGLTRRVFQFLKIAARCGLAVCLCPLDDCEFSGREPRAGRQPEPVPHLHNSQAVGSPGRHITRDPTQWHRVEAFIRYVVRTFGQDPRVILLDLYNEPGNPWIFTQDGTILVDDVEGYELHALQLMELAFQWAREEKPTQPLTAAAWHMPDPFFAGNQGIIPLSHPIDKRALELSDVISIHAYCDLACLQSTLHHITQYGKPILLTEWMARQVHSTYQTSLPTLKELKVGAYQWGLVKGKTQTYLPWPHVAHQFQGDPVWWHDVLDADGTFHDEEEGKVIRSLLYPQNKALSSEIFLMDLSAHMTPDASHECLEHLVATPNATTAGGGGVASATDLSAMWHPASASLAHLAQNDHIGAEELLMQKTSLHQRHTSNSAAMEGMFSHNSLPVVHESEHQVIPSVCSISMATINAAASQVAMEAMGDSMDNDHRHRRYPTSPPLTSRSLPTFGHHLRSPSMEGLDLAELGGIEF